MCVGVCVCVCVCVCGSVTDVWVAGEQLLKDMQLVKVDEAAIMRKAQQWGEKIKTTRASF